MHYCTELTDHFYPLQGGGFCVSDPGGQQPVYFVPIPTDQYGAQVPTFSAHEPSPPPEPPKKSRSRRKNPAEPRKPKEKRECLALVVVVQRQVEENIVVQCLGTVLVIDKKTSQTEMPKTDTGVYQMRKQNWERNRKSLNLVFCPLCLTSLSLLSQEQSENAKKLTVHGCEARTSLQLEGCELFFRQQSTLLPL